MRPRDVADLLHRLADLVEIAEPGEAARRAAAYRRAAQTLENLQPDLPRLRAEGRLTELPGVGPAIARKIEEMLETGTCRLLEDLQRRVPPGVLDLLAVPGIGPRTAGTLFRQLGVDSLPALEEAARAGRLRGLPGFGERREQNLLRELERLRLRAGRIPLGVALPQAAALRDALAAAAGVTVAVAGSLRRGRETVKDIDLVAAAERPGEVARVFAALPQVAEVRLAGDTRVQVALQGGLPCDLRVVAPPAFPAALQYFTGSQAHNVRLRGLARERGLKLNEYGLFPADAGDGEALPLDGEEDLYARLGLDYVPPELREDQGEVEAARAGRLPRLIRLEDVRGDLHLHTDWSDGRASLAEMCAAARDRGYAYVAITDHSPSLAVARGLTADRLRRQLEEIERLRARFPDLVILAGCEVDIRPDGRLDLPDDVLAELDLVIASVHSRLRMGRLEMTARIVAALEHEHVDVLGHPTGRILGYRDPYELDVERVLEVAVETRTVLELNASPERLDLGDAHLRRARELGARFAVSTDAHAPENLDAMAYGILTARRAWLQPVDVINTLPAPELLAFLRRPKRQRW